MSDIGERTVAKGTTIYLWGIGYGEVTRTSRGNEEVHVQVKSRDGFVHIPIPRENLREDNVRLKG